MLKFLGLTALVSATGINTLAAEPTLDSPQVLLSNVATEVVFSGLEPGATYTVAAPGSEEPQTGIADASGRMTLADLSLPASSQITLQDAAGNTTEIGARVIAGWLAIVPPLLAIVLALLFRSVIPALVAGIWFGATLLLGWGPLSWLQGLLNGFQIYVLHSLADTDHASIILFSMMIGGMVGIMTRVGGMSAIVSLIVKRAKTAVSGQVSIWAMGLVIFFDDYGNTLVVGNTARPLSDRLGISREKLAYIVDSTAAPVACIAIATTWIGYEVGLIKDAVAALGTINEAPYSIFLKSIAYSFYPILSILFVLAIALSRRDFGPMVEAERIARERKAAPVADNTRLINEELDPKPGVEQRALNALVPIVVMIGTLFAGLYITGEGNTLSDIVGTADSYTSLMWASLLAALTAGVLAVSQRLLSLNETVEAWFSGVRAMLFTMIILVLAWALSNVTGDLGTANYLITVLGSQLSMEWLPFIVFVLSAITAFSTGSSWGTMGILMPLIVPLTWAVMSQGGDPGAHMPILYSAVACNLAGAVWGDHCSPISDTTVLSSMASGCDHIDHVRTQLPYAVTVGLVALFVGTLPAAYGVPWWVCLLVASGVLALVIRFVGRPIAAS